MASPGTPVSSHQTPNWNDSSHYPHTSIDGQTHGLEALSAAATRDAYTLQSQPSVAIEPSLRRNSVSFHHTEVPVTSVNSISTPNHVRNAIPAPASPSTSVSSSNNNINFLLNPSNSLSPPIDPNLHPTSDNRESPFTPTSLPHAGHLVDLGPNVNVESDHEIAFLLRHFSEAPGQW